MLTQVPTAINRSARQVVLRHPNNLPVVVSRKQVTRLELDAQGNASEMGGSPTLGGMGTLRSEDEAEFEYVELGEGKMLYAAPFSPADMIDRDNAALVEAQREVMIEATAAPGAAGYFEAETGDLVMVEMGLGVILAFEVATVTGTVNVPPYTRRYVLNPRDDLNYLEPFEG